MILLNKLRYFSWLAIQKFKKDSIESRYNKIRKIMENDEYYNEYIGVQLKSILNYSINHTNFYKNCNDTSLDSFPVINKKVIIDSINDFKSDEYNKDNTHKMSTSGSTGIPFEIMQDYGKRKQVLADILYFSNLVGYNVGKKLIFLRNKGDVNTSKLKEFIKNENFIAIQKYDNKTISAIISKIAKKEKNTTILAYASTLNILSNFMDENDIYLNNISGIISGAETITHKTRILVEKHFNCKVVSRYSNQEMGIIAQDSVEDCFRINRASYYIELLQLDSDEKANIGQIGRIVITDLYNKAMPLIRYDTGDLGVVEIDKDGNQYFSKVIGRKLDLLYTTNDEPVCFFALDHLFEYNLDVLQYQIIQNSKYEIIINLIMKNDKKIDEELCDKEIKEILGQDCNITFRYLDEIPITNSGKFRYVISNYSPQ